MGLITNFLFIKELEDKDETKLDKILSKPISGHFIDVKINIIFLQLGHSQILFYK